MTGEEESFFGGKVLLPLYKLQGFEQAAYDFDVYNEQQNSFFNRP